MATTLIQRQEACIARMLQDRTSPKRAAKNRAAAARLFRKQCLSVGYTGAAIDAMLQDIRDMVQLIANSED